MADAKATAGPRPFGTRGARAIVLGPRCGPRCPCRCILELVDEVLEVVDLPAKLGRALAFGIERRSGLGLALLALRDQRSHAQPLLRQRRKIPVELFAFRGDFAAHTHQVGQIRREGFDLVAHVGQHCAKQHRGTHGFERILGADQNRGRRPAPHPLQRRQHFGDDRAPAVERGVQLALANIERS